MWANEPEMAEEWEEEEKNESRSMKITRRQLRRIIRETAETREKALAAAQHAAKKVGYPISGLLELEIHEYLIKKYGIYPDSVEIWPIADEALSIAGEIFGVGDTL